MHMIYILQGELGYMNTERQGWGLGCKEFFYLLNLYIKTLQIFVFFKKNSQ